MFRIGPGAGGWPVSIACLVLAVLVAVLVADVGGRVRAVPLFAPQLEVRLWDQNPAAASSIITETWVGTGSPGLGTWSLDLPLGWGVTNGGSVPTGDIVAEGTMAVDVDCNGTVDEFGPFPLANQPIDPSAVADWTGSLTSWWPLTVSVDGGGADGYDLSADLTTITEAHTFCAPQVFAITLFGRSSPTNVQLLTNAGQGGQTFTMFAVSRGGGHTAQISDSVSIAPTTIPSTDADSDGVIDEPQCGSDPFDPVRRPERTDEGFAGGDENGNGLIDEMPPPGSSGFDCDGDGYKGSAEAHVFGVNRADQDPCGTDGWASDFITGGVPDSSDRLTVSDLTSFLAPARRLNTNPGETGYDVRWDTSPGAGPLGKVINVSDMTALMAGSTGYPPMFEGSRALNGPVCPWGSTPLPTPTPTATPVPTPTATPIATPTPSPLPNGDGDGDGVIDETACGSNPTDPSLRPERMDGAFGGRDDDGDGLTDEPLPAGAAGSDCDGDGYAGNAEDNIFGAGTNRDQDPCGVSGWPSDLVSGGVPDSTDRITVTDLTSFLAPTRRLNTSPGDAGFQVRWDLVPGKGLFADVTNVADLTALIAGGPGSPPMFLGARAFNGPVCPWAN